MAGAGRGRQGGQGSSFFPFNLTPSMRLGGTFCCRRMVSIEFKSSFDLLKGGGFIRECQGWLWPLRVSAGLVVRLLKPPILVLAHPSVVLCCFLSNQLL